MNRPLHRELLDVLEDHSQSEIARETSLSKGLVNSWANTELKEESEYRPRSREDERLRDLRAFAADVLDDGSGPSFEPEGGVSSSKDGAQGPEPKISGVKPGHQRKSKEEAVNAQRELHRERRQEEQARKRQVVRFPVGPVCIVFQGDEHYGNSGCDVDHALRDARLIKRTDGMYAVKVGDIVDNFIVAYLQAQNNKPSRPIREQWQCAQHHLDLISDKAVAVVGGNHGGWSRMLTRIDPVSSVCPDGALYHPNDVQFSLKVGPTTKRVHLRHEWTGTGSSQWNETHQLEKAAKFEHPGSDIYVGGHTHSGLHSKLFAMKNGVYAAAIQTDTYKKFDDYGEKKGYGQYPKEHVAAALVIHEDGSMVTLNDLSRAADYMNTMYRG